MNLDHSNTPMAIVFVDGRASDAQTSEAPPKHVLIDFTQKLFEKK